MNSVAVMMITESFPPSVINKHGCCDTDSVSLVITCIRRLLIGYQESLLATVLPCSDNISLTTMKAIKCLL